MFDEDNELCEECDYYFGVVIVEIDGEEVLVCLGCKKDIED